MATEGCTRVGLPCSRRRRRCGGRPGAGPRNSACCSAWSRGPSTRAPRGARPTREEVGGGGLLPWGLRPSPRLTAQSPQRGVPGLASRVRRRRQQGSPKGPDSAQILLGGRVPPGTGPDSRGTDGRPSSGPGWGGGGEGGVEEGGGGMEGDKGGREGWRGGQVVGGEGDRGGDRRTDGRGAETRVFVYDRFP